MLDAISHGRLDVGFARAFLPEEFDAFERSMDESRARYEHGIDAVLKLWTEPDVVHHDPFYRFGPVTSSPRPVQQPHPPVYIAAVGTPHSFEWAGRQGHGLMIVPYLSRFEDLERNVRRYRETFVANHPAVPIPKVQMSFHYHVAETDAQAQAEAQEPMNQYVQVFRESASAWRGRSSSAYAGYDAIVGELDQMSFDRVLRETRAFIGSPDTVTRQIRTVLERFGDVEPSLQVLFGNMAYEQAERSLRVFASKVMPRFGHRASSPAQQTVMTATGR